MTSILIGLETEFKIHYHCGLAPYPAGKTQDSKNIYAVRKTVREMLSLLASKENKLPVDLSEVSFYSAHLDRHVSVNPQELVEDFIRHKRSRFNHLYGGYRPYVKPDESEFIQYFLKALQSLKTRLETKILEHPSPYAR